MENVQEDMIRRACLTSDCGGKVQDILHFLSEIARNNRRDWFQDHRAQYDAAQAGFREIVERMIAAIGTFDPAITGIPVQSTLYRFYRDTRFSADKSPYKRHFGSYINPLGKKSQHGGYYLHLEPGNCMLGAGAYCLQPPVLKAVRQSIVDRLEEFRAIVEEPHFAELFPVIGSDGVKTLPAGFPRDFPFPQYLRPRNYAVAHRVPDEFFLQEDWMMQAAACFREVKPFLDFVNETIDDCL